MKLLSRQEELVLIAVWRLQENAYSVTIREQVTSMTGQNWSFGAIYDPLERLEKKGLLKASFSDPSPERGGKRKKIYSINREGLKALIGIKALQESVWDGIKKSALENQI
ncbi:PadR family transcriptional regulator [candidate division KSB1 bacterium]